MSCRQCQRPTTAAALNLLDLLDQTTGLIWNMPYAVHADLQTKWDCQKQDK